MYFLFIMAWFCQQHLSWRTLKTLTRQCTWREVAQLRRELTLYQAKTASVSPGEGRQRVFSWTSLTDVLKALVNTARASGTMSVSRNQTVSLIVCTDATSLWKTSATRCDVYLDIYGTSCIFFITHQHMIPENVDSAVLHYHLVVSRRHPLLLIEQHCVCTTFSNKVHI
jgi:hypothetical protein